MYMCVFADRDVSWNSNERELHRHYVGMHREPQTGRPVGRYREPFMGEYMGGL